MAAIKRRGGEIVIQRVHLKSIVGVYRCFGPLPCITHYIIQLAVRKSVDWACRCIVIQIQISMLTTAQMFI